MSRSMTAYQSKKYIGIYDLCRVNHKMIVSCFRARFSPLTTIHVEQRFFNEV